MSTDEAEDQQFLRSINNVHSSFVRFINTTSRNVGVYWIDYNGQAVQYKVVPHRDYLDVNTFETHPWIFIDEETRDRFRVNARDVFYPRRSMRREDVPARIVRTFVRITLPMYTLRDLALRAIKKLLRFDHHAFLLEIPRSLQIELAAMSPRKHDPADL